MSGPYAMCVTTLWNECPRSTPKCPPRRDSDHTILRSGQCAWRDSAHQHGGRGTTRAAWRAPALCTSYSHKEARRRLRGSPVESSVATKRKVRSHRRFDFDEPLVSPRTRLERPRAPIPAKVKFKASPRSDTQPIKPSKHPTARSSPPFAASLLLMARPYLASWSFDFAILFSPDRRVRQSVRLGSCPLTAQSVFKYVSASDPRDQLKPIEGSSPRERKKKRWRTLLPR